MSIQTNEWNVSPRRSNNAYNATSESTAGNTGKSAFLSAASLCLESAYGRSVGAGGGERHNANRGNPGDLTEFHSHSSTGNGGGVMRPSAVQR